METPLPPKPSASTLTAPMFWSFFAAIVLLGISIRVADTASWRRAGPDEVMYRRYVYLMDGGQQAFSVFNRNGTMRREVATVAGTGAMAMPSLCAAYLRTQRPEESMCELPPTRFLYIYTAWIWKNLRWGDAPPLPISELNKAGGEGEYFKDGTRRDPGLAALNNVSCGFSMLLMIAGGLFAWRLLGRGVGLGVLALMACDPLQIHLSQHAMIDGFFAFWALMSLWTTWECLRAPGSKAWLVAHTIVLALMVMTKENSFFAYCALAAVVLANRWLKFGTVTPRFLICSVAGPAAGVLALVVLAGGPGNFIEIYKNLVTKAQTLEYAQLTGDGPWYRYLVDMLIMSPIVLCLAIGALFTLGGRRKEIAFLAIFVSASYLIMCNVRYGMNLRYASIWGMPLRTAAFLMIFELGARGGRWQWVVVTVLTAGLCASEMRQYGLMAGDKDNPFYETLTNDMLQRLDVIKTRESLHRTATALPPASRGTAPILSGTSPASDGQPAPEPSTAPSPASRNGLAPEAPAPPLPPPPNLEAPAEPAAAAPEPIPPATSNPATGSGAASSAAPAPGTPAKSAPAPATKSLLEVALATAQEAAQPYVKQGFSVREDYWGGDLGVEQTKAMTFQLFKGNEYRFWMGTDEKDAKIGVHIYDSDGNLCEKESKQQGRVSEAVVLPARSGTYYAIVEVYKSPQERTHWGMAYGFR